MAYGHSLTAGRPFRAARRVYGGAAVPQPAGGESSRGKGQARRPPTPAGWLNERRGASRT
ncbi:hypothetical protein GCM10012279_20630 [Micromonospora yangpuensis]|nr:hypothetical protein GCM10012279_20630 [Micromonospora yangpuensis]